MDWSTKLALATWAVAWLPVLFLLVAVFYCMWLHKRGVKEPEKQVALLIKASLQMGRRARVSHGERPQLADVQRQLPPAA